MNYPYQQFQNGYYPQQQQYMQQPPQPPMPDNLMSMRSAQNTPRSNGMMWVQGEEGAKAYLVGAGNTVVLWDSETPTIYIKSADMSGMPSMRVLEWTERTGQKAPAQAPASADYITRKEFEDLKARIDSMIGGEKHDAKE